MFGTAFQKLGFSDKEERVYLALAELGQSSATLLSKQTEIPRATLYGVLDALIEKGVASREQRRGASHYVLNSTDSLSRIVERHRNEVSEQEQVAKELITMLTPQLRGRHHGLPSVQIFEGKQNIETMLYDYLPAWRRSYVRSGDPVLWGYQDHTIVETYRKWHEYMWETRSPKEEIRLFTNPTDLEKELHVQIPRREIRALPEHVQFSSSIWIYGDYIVMAITRQKPQYAVQMKDSMLASNLRTIFRLLWRARF